MNKTLQNPKTDISSHDDTLIFEMDDHVEVVYVLDSSLTSTSSTDTTSSEQVSKDSSAQPEILSSSLPIQIPSLPKWRSEIDKPPSTFVAPHIQSLNSDVISGSLPSSRRSRLNPI